LDKKHWEAATVLLGSTIMDCIQSAAASSFYFPDVFRTLNDNVIRTAATMMKTSDECIDCSWTCTEHSTAQCDFWFQAIHVMNETELISDKSTLNCCPIYSCKRFFRAFDSNDIFVTWEKQKKTKL
jgi:hypothetical protein